MGSAKNDGISLEHRAQIIGMTGVGLFVWNLNTDEVTYSEEWAHILGYELDELVPHVSTWESMVLPEDLGTAEKKIKRYLSGDAPMYEAEFRMKKKDGTIIWGHDKGRVTQYTPEGKPLLLCGVLQDITSIRRVQEKLIQRTQLLNLAIDVAEFSSWAWDLSKNSISYNNAFLKMLGLSRSEITGTIEEWTEMNHPDDLPGTLKNLNDYIEGKTTNFECEMRMRHKDGHYVWTRDVGRIMRRDEDGKPTYIIGGHLNIDSLKNSQCELQNTLQELETHKQNLESEIATRTRELVERDNLLLAVNEVSSKLISINAEQDFNEVMGDSLEMVAQAYGTSELALWRRITLGEKCFIHLDHMYNDGTKIYFDTSDMGEYIEKIKDIDSIVHMKPDGNMIVSFHMLDQDYVKKIEQRDTITYDFMDNIPAELSDALTGYSENSYAVLLSPVYLSDGIFGFVSISNKKEDVVYTDAQESMLKVVGNLFANCTYKYETDARLRVAHEEALLSTQAKSNFLANMSHEIRTPLNAILGMAEIILRESVGRATEEYAHEIKSASESLLMIINDILDISKIESGKLEIIDMDYYITSMLNDVINLSKIRLTEKPVLLTTFIDKSIPALLNGDEMRIKQILLNLLSNAIKFTRKGNIHFSATCEHADGKAELIFVVQDTGIGIKQKDMERLFMQFERVDTKKNRNIEGTGLGLAITKQLCEMMGGTISVTSEIGVGSVFTVTIPQTYEAYEPIVSLPEPQKVLVYEARELYAKNICESIKDLGCSATVCTNQSDLFNSLSEGTYDFLFAPSVHLKKIKNLKQSLNLDFTIVLMTDPADTTIYKDIVSANLPISCLQLSSIFGSNDPLSQAKHQSDHFIAPDARVLIVDDNIVNLKVAKGLLAPYKFGMDTAINGVLAVEMVQKNKYDLVFMDHMMPEMDGIDATIAIRKLGTDYYKNLPIVALTANALVGARELFVQEGMNDFLAKPIEMKKLHTVLLKWVPPQKIQYISEESVKYSPKPTHDLQIEGVDTSHGIRLMGGDLDDYLDVLKSFYSDGLLKLKAIRDSIASHDLTAFRIDVHAVKSAAAAIGATAVSERAKKLEIATIDGDLQFIEANVDGFLREYSIALEAIKDKIATKDTAKPKDVGDFSLLGNNLDVLENALEMLDIDIIEQTLDACMEYKWNDEIAKLFEQIKVFVESFEYYNARPLVNQIRGKIQH